jgi:hypothetical protein
MVEDTTIYGRCCEATTMNVLYIVDAKGDTLNFIIQDEADVFGGKLVGDKMAVISENEYGEDVAKKVINIMSLMGRWTSLDKDFEIKDGGVIESHQKAETKTFTSWKIYNGQLILAPDTFDINMLGPDSLKLENKNGIYGFKPTYGAVSRYGVVAMASSTDCVSFMTRTPDDMDLLMQIASGQDSKDLTTLPDYYNDSKVNEVKRIGIVKDFDNDSIDIEIREALKKKCDLLKSKGYEIVELSMPSLKYALNAYYVIVPAEVASNLSRYDGVRYGFRSEKSKTLDDLYENTRDEGFMPENKRRIMIGNFVLSSGFYDAYFLQAAKVRTLIVKEFERSFEQCDFVLMPISPNPPFKIGEKVNDPVAMYMEDMMSVSANLAGVPGLAIPAGETAKGLPIGLQLVGPRRSDKNLIQFAKEL